MKQRHILLVGAGALLATATAVACNGFSGSDNGGNADSADAADDVTGLKVDGGGGGAEAGSATDAGGTPIDASGFLVFDNFESDTTVCSGWQVRGATPDLSTTFALQDAGHSCHVCVLDSSGNPTGLYQSRTVTESGSYQLDYWVHDDPVASLADGGLFIPVQAFVAADGGGVAGYDQQAVAVGGGWTHVTSVAPVVNPSSGTANVTVVAKANNQCFYVDDVRWFRQ